MGDYRALPGQILDILTLATHWDSQNFLLRTFFICGETLDFLPELHMTSEEEGRAKPPLSTVPSSASLCSALPSAIHLVGRACLCHRCEQDPRTREREGGEGERASRGEWRARAWREDTTETPSRDRPAPPGPPTQVLYHTKHPEWSTRYREMVHRGVF